MVYEMSNLNMDVKSFTVTCATNPRFLKKFYLKSYIHTQEDRTELSYWWISLNIIVQSVLKESSL